MIVVDTNVISEPMRPTPDANVMLWYASCPRMDLFTTTVTVAELMAGIGYLPDGKRKFGMEHLAQSMFEADFAGRILPFDLAAAEEYARISARRRRMGRPIKPLDAQVAAIASANGMSVATRDISDFADCGVELINPWDT